jgi:PPK2 family polyphosphate:nucleotide phosphotransferase
MSEDELSGVLAKDAALARAAKVRDELRVDPATVELSAIDPRGVPGLPRTRAVRRDPKLWSQAAVAGLGAGLSQYQERLFASAKGGGGEHSLLLVLQAMDCGGKDGTVRHVAGTMNPQGLHIVSFGVPTEQERRHDFLWRIRRALPPTGYIGVFNRSHYEDVLVARVRELVQPEVWQKRYDLINKFEAELTDSGVAVVKVMLHISPAEQALRLRERLDRPDKRWKYNPGDLDERARWPDYQQAYADVLRRCSTPNAPWYVVPADRKWYRNWAVANLLLATLAELDPQYPLVTFDVATERERLRNDPLAAAVR